MISFMMKIAASNEDNLGILLTVCKGLGKCCSVGELLLDRDIPPNFLIICIKSIVLRP